MTKAQRINEVQQCSWQPSGEPGQEEMDLVGGENLWTDEATFELYASRVL